MPTFPLVTVSSVGQVLPCQKCQVEEWNLCVSCVSLRFWRYLQDGGRVGGAHDGADQYGWPYVPIAGDEWE